MAGTLNYYFVLGWGRRAGRHFRDRYHLLSGSLLPPPCSEVVAGTTHSPQFNLTRPEERQPIP